MKQKRGAIDIVNQAMGWAYDVAYLHGRDASDQIAQTLLEGLRPIIKDGKDPTMINAFIACCQNGLRDVTIEILMSGQVSLGESYGPDEILGALEACSIPVDAIPEGPLKAKLKLR